MSASSVERLAWSVPKFAEAVGLSKSRVYELVASGELPARRAGGRVLIEAEAGKAWLDALPEYEASWRRRSGWIAAPRAVGCARWRTRG
jgi:excisionase family DNA binding protein